MPEGLQRLIEPFTALSPGKRMLVAGVALLSVAAFALLIFIANRTDYKPLFTNLSSEDAGEIVKKMKDTKTPYQITADGKGILVPADKVYELRLSLASEGLPQGGGIGFEIFDRKNFGMTEFVQKLNYQRALQGELSRTISQISGVEQARIHLVIPEKTLFKENEKPATASIVLKMKGNRSLRDSEVQGIVHLVSSSIEGMDPEHVTILDGRGKILSKGNGTSDVTSKATTAMQETQRGYEKSTEERLQSLLDRIVGSGKSVARVSATFDFKQVERVEEKFDPESIAVRSEQRTEEKGASTTTNAGVPGVQTNLGRAPGAASSTGGGSKNDETLNYEVSRSTAKIIEPVGALSKISVAVLVDGKYEVPAAVKEGATAKPKYIPRSPDELQKIEALVKSAVGFNAERGDQLTVQNVPFQDTGDAGVAETPKWWTSPFFMSLMKNLLIGLGFLALILFVIRPLLASLRVVRPPVLESFEAVHDGVEKLSSAERAQIAMQMAEQHNMIEMAKKDPYQVAQVLQNWMGEDK
ncbi:flagellar basal-body MS-ring/collar protein FliF [Geobacter sp. SVR]|uniref:flagellar basal-body MS-ring/collar protein FliF n=1 Tax=Geobacter sp. SVR TaxID=2495594 RepID=UPI00143EF82C|nr:flagellar basal-body MS-ring/collar protein FliF [Geobacter sp. SVR]BCS55828.1 flagellar M-ring protein [Geobacter sp. SVR]GCF83832.1 flagellar M-ring protein [Geobacter sp. SVR]